MFLVNVPADRFWIAASAGMKATDQIYYMGTIWVAQILGIA